MTHSLSWAFHSKFSQTPLHDATLGLVSFPRAWNVHDFTSTLCLLCVTRRYLTTFFLSSGLLVVGVIYFLTGTSIDPCDKPARCFSGTVVPDPEDCQKYYVCSGLQLWNSVTCPPDLLFDGKELKCVNASVANCQPSCSYDGTFIPLTTLAPG